MPATLLIAVAVTAVVSAVVTYLFLRVNPNKRAKLDKAVEKIKEELDGPDNF